MDSNSNLPQREFTDKCLNAKFSFSFTRKQLIVLVNSLRPIQLPVGDIRSHVLWEILEEVEARAIQSITEADYKIPEAQKPIPINSVKTN
jgi:hypothetical protein